MIIKAPDRMSQDEQGVWWFKRSEKVRGRCAVHTCEACGETVVNWPQHFNRFCSKTCSGPALHKNHKFPAMGSGPSHHRWRGGTMLNRSGYRMVWKPDHPLLAGTTRKYVLEHRLVMEEHLGRLLTSTERVHHKNGDKLDNRIENLELWEFGHPPGQRVEERQPMISIPLSLFLALCTRPVTVA